LANQAAITGVSKAILGLIETSCPRALLNAPQFALYHTQNFDSPMAEGFSVYLYWVALNAGSRNLGPRRTADDRLIRPPVPVDLHYLITPWAADPARQQQLLAWTMRFFEDLAVLPSGVLNHYLAESETFRPEETVELVPEVLSLSDYLNLWDKLKPKMQTSLSYAARMVLLDADADVEELPRVQKRRFDAGQVEG
jgi:hypothetical protein